MLSSPAQSRHRPIKRALADGLKSVERRYRRQPRQRNMSCFSWEGFWGTLMLDDGEILMLMSTSVHSTSELQGSPSATWPWPG